MNEIHLHCRLCHLLGSPMTVKDRDLRIYVWCFVPQKIEK